MSETPTLKLLYEDEDSLAYVHILLDGKLVIHSDIKVPKTPSILKKARDVSMLIDETFKDKGVKKLYTWGIGDTMDTYNVFLGYFPTGEEVIIEGWQGEPIFEFSKDLI